jgi:hypothetical protein
VGESSGVAEQLAGAAAVGGGACGGRGVGAGAGVAEAVASGAEQKKTGPKGPALYLGDTVYLTSYSGLFVAPSLKCMCGANAIKGRHRHACHQQSHRHHHAHDCTFHWVESFRWSATHAIGVHRLNIPCGREVAGCLCSRWVVRDHRPGYDVASEDSSLRFAF